MNKNKIRISFLILFVTNLGFAQMKKAERHFSNFNYAEAIPCYEKVLKGKSNDRQEAQIVLGYLIIIRKLRNIMLKLLALAKFPRL